MAGHRFLLTLVLCAISGPMTAQDQDAADSEATPRPIVYPPSAGPERRPDSDKRREGKDFQDPQLKEIRDLFEKLPAELRKQLLEKTRRWQQLPADEQAHFRFMRGEREKRAQKAVDDMIQASGLKLDEAQKMRFADIYKRERGKLEESLRNEMDLRRKERLPELQKSVVTAFQAGSPAPAPSATP